MRQPTQFAPRRGKLGFTERETHFMDRGGDWNDVRAAASNLSLFAERRILEIRMPSAKPGKTGSEAIVATCSRAAIRIGLIVINVPKLDRDAQGSEWVRAVETHGALVQVWPVDASRLDRLVACAREAAAHESG